MMILILKINLITKKISLSVVHRDYWTIDLRNSKARLSARAQRRALSLMQRGALRLMQRSALSLPMTTADITWLKFAQLNDILITMKQSNPKLKGGASRERYESYKRAKTLKDFCYVVELRVISNGITCMDLFILMRSIRRVTLMNTI